MADTQAQAPTAEELAEKLDEAGGDDVVVDPGATEGMKSSEKDQNFPPEGSKRFDKIYGKMKGFERELLEARKEKESLVSMVEEMKEWNKQLAATLEKSTDTIASVVEVKGDDKAAIAENNINNQLKQLKEDYKTAMKDVDYDAAADINEKILELKIDLKSVKEIKATKDKEKASNTSDTSADRGRTHPDVVKFAESTPWFAGENIDPEMKAYAMMLDDVLAEDPKWKGKPVSTRLAEVKERVEKRYNWENPNRDLNLVEGAGSSKPKGKDSINLSPAELQIAEGLGQTAEAFAKQKALIKKGRR